MALIQLFRYNILLQLESQLINQSNSIMIHTVYSGDLQDILELLDQNAEEIEYFVQEINQCKLISTNQQQSQSLEIENIQQQQTNLMAKTNNIRIRSKNRIILYALCAHIHKQISQQHYRQIENQQLSFPQQQRQIAVYFMGRAVSKYLPNFKNNYEAELLLQYLREENKLYDVKMILKFQSDVDLSTTVKRQGNYAIIYFSNQQTQAMIDDFKIHRILIENQTVKRKLQFLNLIQDKQMENHSFHSENYGFAEQRKVNYKIMQLAEENLNHSHSSSFMTSKTKTLPQSSINISFQSFVIYGQARAVDRFAYNLREQIQEIRFKIFERTDQFFNSYIFAITRQLAVSYGKCKIFMINNDTELQVFYHCSIEAIFDSKLMGYDKLKTVKLSSVKLALKQPAISQFSQHCSDLMFYEDKTDGNMVVGQTQLIQLLQNMSQRLKKSKKVQKQQQVAGIGQKATKNGSEMLTNNQQKNKQIIQLFNNLQINGVNYKSLIQNCTELKVQQFMTFKIDVGDYIRITNRVKKCNTIYIVFQNSFQLLQLQTIIEDVSELSYFARIAKECDDQIFPKPKTLYVQNSKITLKLYPFIEQFVKEKQKYFGQLMKTIKSDSTAIFKTLVCSIGTFKQLLGNYLVDFNIIFALNQHTPFIDCDQLLEWQIQQHRVKIGKQHSEYFAFVRGDVNNVDFRSPANLKKQEILLRQIFQRNLHEYEIGDYMLSQIDEYNISYMIAEKLQSMFFILSKKPTEQYIYLTFFQKLFLIVRDKNGNFANLQQASFSKDISRSNQQLIRPVIHRANLTGQRFISINIPIDHIKLATLQNITRLATGNQNLVQYYLKRITETERYIVKMRPTCTKQYIEKAFAKQYILRFDNTELKRQIKNMDLGYGNIKKWREKPFVCMEADHYICEKVLKKIQQNYKQAKNKKENK